MIEVELKFDGFERNDLFAGFAREGKEMFVQAVLRVEAELLHFKDAEGQRREAGGGTTAIPSTGDRPEPDIHASSLKLLPGCRCWRSRSSEIAGQPW